MNTSLLVIDIQNQVVAEKPFAIEERLALWQESIVQARQEGIEVIYVRHSDEELVEGSPGWDIHASVAPMPGEKIVDKHFNSAFKGTDLQAYLEKQGIEKLIIMGMATNFCVDTTIKVAFELGYQLAVIKEGTTTSFAGNLSVMDLIDHYQSIWSWNFAQVDTLENILRG